MNLNVWIGILIPFAGTALGAAMVFFMRKEMNEKTSEDASWVRVRRDDGGFCVVASDPGDRYGGRERRTSVDAAGGGLSARHGLPAPSGHPYAASSFHRGETGGRARPFKKTTMLVLAVTLHNIPEGMAVGRYICRSDDRKHCDDAGRGICPVGRHCHSEFSGGGDHIHAASEPGAVKETILRIRCALGHRGASSGTPDDPADQSGRSAASVSAFLCSRSHDLCGGGGTDPGGADGGPTPISVRLEWLWDL